MVQPEEEKNRGIQQRREIDPRESGPAVSHPAPHPGELVGRKQPPYEVVGTDALSPLLMHVDFPATVDDVKNTIGQARIPISSTRTLSVSEVLDKVVPKDFRSSREVEDAVKRVWDQIAPHPDRGSHHAQRDNLWGREPQ